MTNILKMIGLVALLLASTACSRIIQQLDTAISDDRTYYEQAEALPVLEVKPELAAPANTSPE